MKNLSKQSALLIAAALASYGCEAKNNDCDLFPSKYENIEVSISSLEKSSFNLPFIKKAVPTIRRCYPRHKYMNWENKLEIWEVRKYKQSLYFIVAELYGVEDLRLLFMVNESGEIVSSYQGSM